jgi:pullulanase/glycogen debranching enzyme
VTWHGTDGAYDISPGCRTLAFFLDGSGAEDDDLYVMTNAHVEAVRFRIQEGRPASWNRVVDTGLASPDEFSSSAGPQLDGSGWYELGPRSAAVFRRARA